MVTETKLLKTGFLRKYFRDKAAELRATMKSKALPFLNALKRSQEEPSRSLGGRQALFPGPLHIETVKCRQ
jgi:hypothetical protein